MIPVAQLPSLNAVLNSLSAVLLVCGYFMIRNGKVSAHRAFMISAFVTSILFLISYLVYHFHVISKPFPGVGPVRVLYFVILISHTILAALVPVLAILTLYRALTRDFEKHRKIARWTLPIWLYVSVTGVIVYWMLYRINWL
jgi:putative membrane protein